LIWFLGSNINKIFIVWNESSLMNCFCIMCKGVLLSLSLAFTLMSRCCSSTSIIQEKPLWQTIWSGVWPYLLILNKRINYFTTLTQKIAGQMKWIISFIVQFLYGLYCSIIRQMTSVVQLWSIATCNWVLQFLSLDCNAFENNLTSFLITVSYIPPSLLYLCQQAKCKGYLPSSFGCSTEWGHFSMSSRILAADLSSLRAEHNTVDDTIFFNII
jgi:hypothetical protein